MEEMFRKATLILAAVTTALFVTLIVAANEDSSGKKQ